MCRFLCILLVFASLAFSVSVDKQQKYRTIRSEILALNQKKIAIVDQIFAEQKQLSREGFSCPPVTTTPSRLQQDNQRDTCKAIQATIQIYERKLDAIDKQINRLNEDLRLCLGLNQL